MSDNFGSWRPNSEGFKSEPKNSSKFFSSDSLKSNTDDKKYLFAALAFIGLVLLIVFAANSSSSTDDSTYTEYKSTWYPTEYTLFTKDNNFAYKFLTNDQSYTGPESVFWNINIVSRTECSNGLQASMNVKTYNPESVLTTLYSGDPTWLSPGGSSNLIFAFTPPSQYGSVDLYGDVSSIYCN